MQGESVIGTGRKSESKGKRFRAEGEKKKQQRESHHVAAQVTFLAAFLLKIPLFTGAELHKVTFTCTRHTFSHTNTQMYFVNSIIQAFPQSK